MDIEKLKYPIGTFTPPNHIIKENLEQWIATLENFPAVLCTEVANLTSDQLDTPYRPQGWTIRQVIHHCADSHMNSLIRLKLALTEENPTIKPYEEARWAELDDSKKMGIEPSLKIIEGIHKRWVALLKNSSVDTLSRTFYHPENKRTTRIDENIGLYAWHCDHHLAHIQLAKKKLR